MISTHNKAISAYVLVALCPNGGQVISPLLCNVASSPTHLLLQLFAFPNHKETPGTWQKIEEGGSLNLCPRRSLTTAIGQKIIN